MAEAVRPRLAKGDDSAVSLLHYYVYYRVDPAHSELAAAVVRSFQDQIFCRTGVRGRRLHRRDEPLLWMEVYEPVPAAVDLAAVLADPPAEVLALLEPGAARATECFAD